MTVLKNIETGLVLSKAHDIGFDRCEIFAEKTSDTVIRWDNGVHRVEFLRSSGAALRCFTKETVMHFHTNSLSTSGLLALLGSPQHNTTSLPTDPLEPISLEIWEAKQRCLGKLAQTSRLKNRTPHLVYRERIRDFQIVSTNQPDPVGDGDRHCSLAANWGTNSTELWGSHPEKFLSELLDDGLLARKAQFLELQPWPAPKGELAIRWSPRALAKWWLHFVRAFEADLVMGENSFLTHFPCPLSTPLKMMDSGGGVDHEGSERKDVCFFRDGKPRALACDRSLADELSVSVTGHCRRASYRTPPTVGFWAPTMISPHTESQGVLPLKSGLHVEDLTVLDFQPQNGEISLYLDQCHLVHDGQIGDPIAPIELRQNVIALIQSLEKFSATQRITLPLSKDHQQLVTEVEVPGALSKPLPLQGTVPASQYW